MPLVTTLVGTPSAIGANVSAVIVNDGGGGSITTKGFVYSITSTNSNPTIGGTGVTTVTGQMVNTTNMATLLTGLTVGTAYTFKAYAVNATGTGYTASSSFTTLGMNSPPSISYTTPLNYVIGASATISPINIGGIIPALNYGTTSVFAGSTADSFLDSPIGTSAKLNGPLGMAMDSAGNTYFADAANQRIRKITPAGAVSTIAGSGYYSFGYGWFSDNSTGTTATFSWPVDLAIDEVRNCLYVADKENNRIRKVSLTSPYAVTTIAGTGTSASTDGTGTTTASFSKPSGVKMDPTGTYLYVTDRGTNKIRKITIGSLAVSTIAGSGTVGTVDNYTGTLATFNEPIGIALDANYIYVSDFTGNKIRKISNLTPFTVTTVAGSGTIGSLDATGTGATFYNPLGIQVDGAGNLLIADSANNKIRKITPSGVVSTIVKEGTAAYFNSPAGIVFNPTTGKAYVSEWLGDKVSQLELTGYNITPALPTGLAFNKTSGIISGTPTTVTGPVNYIVSGTNYYGVSNTTVAITTANLPTITTTVATIITTTTASSGGNVTSNGGITLTAKGICWSTSPTPTIADSKTTESIATGAFTSAIAGLSAATTYYVRAYATNSIGTTYGGEVSFTTLINAPSISYTTPQNYIINTLITPLVSTNTGGEMPNALLGQVSTFAGTGLIGAVDGVGATASFNDPYGITIDASGNLFIGDRQNYKIRKITAAGVVSTIAGSGTFGSYNATGTSATFNSPRGVALDATGNIYVADYSNNLIRKISTAGLVSTLAGSGGSGLVDGNGTTARIGRPYGVVVDASGDVFVTDGNNYAIRKITPTGDVTTLAGNGEAGMTNGTGTNATFNNIRGITIDAFNNLYVTDTNKIRKITPAGVVTDFAGIGTGSNNGPIISASFNSPQGLAIDALGNIYVVDSLNNLIRKITTTGIVTTIAGSGIQGATDGLNTEASFYQPSGVAVDASGNVYITDSRNHKIRKISSVGYSISPALPLGLTLDATGSITGTPTLASPATDYTVTATNAGGSSTTTITLAVLETPTNEPPTASNQTLCQGALVSNLVATGTSLKWYDVATGGVSLSTSTPLVSGTYYVSQTNGGVESDRTTVVVTLTTTTTWTGTASTDWNTASNWSCDVVPVVSSDVIIAAATFAPVISSNVAINTLTLNTSTSLIVPSGFNLTVTNYIHNSGTLTVQNNANLIQVDEVTNTGNIIVNRYSAPIVRLDHTLWSSPVEGQNLFTFSPATLTNRFYTYNTGTNSYVTTGLTSASTFIAGKGFAVRAPNNYTAVAPTPWAGTFTGVPNNGTIPFTLNTTDVGYNLVGNPYPSAIDTEVFVTGNPTIGGTLYFYAHSLSMNANGVFPEGTNYAVWNSTGPAAASHILGDLHLTPEVPNGIIQVGQGFLVKAIAAGNLNFTNAMRVGSNGNQFFRTNTIEKHRMWLNLKTGAGIEINQILVGYITDATQAEDRNFDGLSFGNTGSFLSSKIATNDYVIQGRSLPFDSNDIVPLGFKADTAGTYSISLTNSDGIFADTQDVFLKDNLTGITHDIKASAYDFASNSGTFDARFSLIYTSDLANNTTSFTSNSVVVFKPNQWFAINTNGIIMKDVLVYDMAGRLIFQQSDINANTTVLKGLSPTNGILLVKIVSNENEVVTVKVSN